MSFDEVPNHLKNQELCDIAFKSDVNSIQMFPPEFITREMAFKAVQQHGTYIGVIPPNIIDLELCELAVNSTGQALSLIPKEFRTYEICLKSIENCHLDTIFPQIPKQFRTSELLSKAIESNPLNIYYFTDQEISDELIEKAIRLKPFAITCLFKKEFNEKYLKLALSLQGDLIEYFPGKFQTIEYHHISITEKPSNIWLIEKKYITPELENLFVNLYPDKKDYLDGEVNFFAKKSYSQFFINDSVNDEPNSDDMEKFTVDTTTLEIMKFKEYLASIDLSSSSFPSVKL